MFDLKFVPLEKESLGNSEKKKSISTVLNAQEYAFFSSS